MKAKLASELFSQAIVDGNLERVKDLVLNQGYDINMIDAHNQPMFTRAILSQNMDIINFFFEQNADINPTCADGKYIFMTPLMACIRFVINVNPEMEAVFSKLLEAGANPNPSNSIVCSSLTEAIENYNNPSITRSIVEKLITSYNANINYGEGDNRPIIAAITKGDLELVKFLVEKGADIQIDGNCDTTIITAIQAGKPDIVKYLVYNSKGAFNVTELFQTSINNYHNTEITKILGSNLNEESIKKICAHEFTSAITRGDLETVKYLVLTQGVDINMLDDTLTPIFSLVIRSQNKDIINFFFEQKAHVNPLHKQVLITPFGSAVHSALASKSAYAYEVLDKLFDLEANPNPSNSIITPLDIAINSNFSDANLMIEGLIDRYKADVNHGGDSQKPIIAAIKKGDLELVKFLVEKGADIQIDGNCDTTITSAERFNQAAITKYLIEKSLADNKTFSTKVIMEIGRKSQNQEILNLFNSTTNIDPNELAQAISQGNLHKIEYLVLAQGADINMLDSALTPMFSLAILSQNKDIINFFFEQKAHVNPLHEKVSMTPLEATAVIATKNTAIEIIDSIFFKLLTHGAEINPNNQLLAPLLLALQENNCLLSSKFMIKGVLKINGLEANVFRLTLPDIIKQLQDIDNIEFMQPIETNRQYLDIVMQVYQKDRYKDENKEHLNKFYEIMKTLFYDENKVAKLKELGATHLDAALIYDDVNAIHQISSFNTETNIYSLAQKYRMAGLNEGIYPNSKALSISVALNDALVSISSLPHNAFVTQSHGSTNNLLVNIKCDGEAAWDYNLANHSFKHIESSFSTTILLGNGSQYISSSDISNIFNHDRMSILKGQNLEFALVIIDSHDSKETKAFSSVFKAITTKLAKSTVVFIDSCYSGQYHEEYVPETGVFLISASTSNETSCGADNLFKFSKYFSNQPNLLGILKYCVESYTKSTPCFSGQIGKKVFKAVPIKNVLQELDSNCLSDDFEANEVIQVVQNKAPDKTLELWSTISTDWSTQTYTTESEAWGHALSYYLNQGDEIVHIGDNKYDNYGDSDNCICIII